MPTKQPIHATTDYAEDAPDFMDGKCAWPGCNQNINRYAPYCMTHSRYVTNALFQFGEETTAHIYAVIDKRPAGPAVALNLIRAVEQARGLDYMRSKIGGAGI